MAESYLKRAQRRLKDAERAVEENFVPDAVRYAQECVEISTKAILRLVGIEYPKAHDLSATLQVNAERFPEWLRTRIPEVARSIRELAKARGPAFYGDEERGLSPEDLFSQEYARESVGKARSWLKLCSNLLTEWKAKAS